MKLIISQVIVQDIHSPYHGKRCDVLIKDGFIDKITSGGKMKAAGVKLLNGNGCELSPGFVDLRASLRDPGFEQKENLESAAKAASAGGFTGVASLPNTIPAIQTKTDIEYVLRKSETLPVHIYPYGAITRNRAGEELNELFDMHQAGAKGFSDGNKTIMAAGLMERAMQYSTLFGSLIVSHAEDKSIAGSGMMHEGPVSTGLGLKGIPNLAEELIVNRDIELARYTNSRLHIAHVSSKGSVDLIRKAKKAKLNITCDVAVANLVWTDEALHDFDSLFKLTPPLRGRDDQKALWEGIADGTIDCIVSDHSPEDPEHKDVEFEYAAHGMIQLQTLYPLLAMYAPKNIKREQWIQAITHQPRKILGLTPVVLQEGSPAELCLHQPESGWVYQAKNNHSRSSNSPLLNNTLTGKIVATVNKNRLYKHS